MIVIKKTFGFEASHQLMHHDGKCSRLHGHSYKFTLEVAGELIEEGPKQNMVCDYGDIGTEGKRIEKMLDHYHLNDVLKSDMPTAEIISKFIFYEVDIPNLWAVSVSETEATSARYCPTESRLFEVGFYELERMKERLYGNIRIGAKEECWPWQGSTDRDGYGYCIYKHAGTNKAHRLMAWLRGYDIGGMEVLHSCDNPPCCNPSHLRVGTHEDNEADKDARNRRPRGEDHSGAILSEEIVKEIWNAYQHTEGGKQRFVELHAIRNGVTEGTISHILNGRSWNHITGLEKR